MCNRFGPDAPLSGIYGVRRSWAVVETVTNDLHSDPSCFSTGPNQGTIKGNNTVNPEVNMQTDPGFALSEATCCYS